MLLFVPVVLGIELLIIEVPRRNSSFIFT